MNSFEIIKFGVLDVSAATTLRVGQGVYQIPQLKLDQEAVPTTYNLALMAAALKEKTKMIQATSSLSSSVSPSTVIKCIANLAIESKTTASEVTSATEESKLSSAPAESSSAAVEPVTKLTTEPSTTAGSLATTTRSVVPTASKT
ncbi:hypothetical protein H2248_003271 [Termitomyces sp. 'cryptogamus']|nr:hypothetical protein H2248_003271 [Termitomyces sp. 'cryptogamus']